MTNWPNIQEYRNFEAKFFDNPKHNDNSAAETVLESVIKDEYKHEELDDFIHYNKLHNGESKTVRCVIKKDFEEAFKKLDRGDSATVNYETVRPKTQETTGVDQSVANKIRLQNHLKWMKQKEEEYLQKKEAERIAQQKKKEEELRLEKIKKQKEREKEEKLKEWQEQKAREKEERKKEKMVMKVLEKELKAVTPVVDKEKLIEEWVKLKNKQKQMEAEKKAEILKKEEESKEIRQNLAKLSYMQWKERIKGRMMTLPKNGYQIFGPKPVPVVKEDWNHNFISSSPRNESMSLRNIKSNTNTSLSFRGPIKELDDLSKDIFYLNGIKSRSPSFYHLKTSQSGVNLYNVNGKWKEKNEMPLKELQPGIVENWNKNAKSCYQLNDFLNYQDDLFKKTKNNIKTDELDYLPNYLYPAEADQNHCFMADLPKNSSKIYDSPKLPNKKKIDLYINRCSNSSDEEVPEILKKLVKTKEKPKKEIKTESCITQPAELKKKNFVKEKIPTKKSNVCLQNKVKVSRKGSSESKDDSVQESVKGKTCRRSRSYDKPVKKLYKDREKASACSSRSVVKIPRLSGEPSKPLRLSKSKGSCCPKRKSKRLSKPSTPETPNKKDKKRTEPEIKPKKKLKKKVASLSKSFTCSDSPYCAKKTPPTSLSKPKGVGKKNGETKSERTIQSRKLSTTKI